MLYLIPKGILFVFHSFFYKYLIPIGIFISSSRRDEIFLKTTRKIEHNAVGMTY